MSFRSSYRSTTSLRKRRAMVERLESRHLMSAIPLGATPQDTAEFMLGRVAVIPVLFESTGQIDTKTQTWTPEEIDAAIEKTRVGVQWWADTLDTLGTVHELEFVIDDSFARNPFPTPYEPIDRRSQEASLYIDPFVRAQGVTQAISLEDAVQQFNHASRLRLGTDWAFTIFIIDSSDDADGQFATGSEFGIAHAFPGGLYIVTPSTRPASTITHETGHIFWARDEYPGGGSWTDRRGYYNAQNLNASNNPTPGFVQEVSIMRAGTVLNQSFTTRYLPASTMAMIGWLDSDGDGIFDVADVPLDFEGTGSYDVDRGVFTFDGNARAVPLPNQNSSGTKNDITLNRVDRIEYRVDGGPWLTASEVNAQVADISFELQIAPFDSIELRAIDTSIGVTSETLVTSGLLPIVSGSAIGGVAFVGSDLEGEEDSLQNPLQYVTAAIRKPDGSPLLSGQVDASQRSEGVLDSAVSGATFFAKGVTLDGQVATRINSGATNDKSFHYYNLQNATWENAWNVFRQLEVTFDETVGEVSLNAIGITGRGSYARLEAYDSSGELISRATSGILTPGQSQTLSVNDAQGRIASVLAFGHQSSNVAFDSIEFGSTTTIVTDRSGVFQFTGIPDGDYQLTLTPDRLIYQYENPGSIITVSGNDSTPILANFQRVSSPWLNSANPYDVDSNGEVQALDALKIINEISRNGARTLSDPTQISQFFDTSDDGLITALDALRVINELSRRGRNRAPDAEVLNDANTADVVVAGWDLEQEKRKQTILDELLPLSVEPIVS